MIYLDIAFIVSCLGLGVLHIIEVRNLSKELDRCTDGLGVTTVDRAVIKELTGAWFRIPCNFAAASFMLIALVTRLMQ